MYQDTTFWDELAIKSYKTILKKNPNSPLIYNNLALAYARTNRENKAIRALQKAIKQDKTYTDAYYHLGNLYKKHDKIKEANSCFKNYDKFSP